MIRSGVSFVNAMPGESAWCFWFRDKPSGRQFSVFRFPFSVFRFQNLDISSRPIRAIRLIRGLQSSHFSKRV